MQTRNHVTLDTAIKLKAAGFPQNTNAMWCMDGKNNPWELGIKGTYDWHDQPGYADYQHHIAAPTAQELADELPGIWSVSPGLDGGFDAYAQDGDGISEVTDEYAVTGDTICEALAALWLATHQPTEQEGGR